MAGEKKIGKIVADCIKGGQNKKCGNFKCCIGCPINNKGKKKK